MLLSELDTDNSGTVEFDEFAAWSAMLPRPRGCGGEGGQRRAEGCSPAPVFAGGRRGQREEVRGKAGRDGGRGRTGRRGRR